MKKFLNAFICTIIILSAGGCSNEKKSIAEKSNGDVENILLSKKWKPLCSDKECYIEKKDDNHTLMVKKGDDYSDIKKDTNLTDKEIASLLEWMTTRKEKNQLSDSEIASSNENKDIKDKDKMKEEKQANKEEKQANKESKDKNTDSNVKKQSNSKTQKKEESQNKNEETKKPVQQPSVNKPHEDKPTNSDNSISTGKRNALQAAINYINIMSFSHDGLIKQLNYEGYSNEEGKYAADNCGANWNEQALKSANTYLGTAAFSNSGLINQLTYEGFTSSQASYGANNCGANWNEQAAKAAKEYMGVMSFSRQDLINQLIHDGYTQSQAEYGVQAAGY